MTFIRSFFRRLSRKLFGYRPAKATTITGFMPGKKWRSF